MAGIKHLLGENATLKHNNEEVDPATFAGKSVGLYFSAHWCPPCRSFTPDLVEWYRKMKAGPKADSMELVFISSDRDEKSFDEYYAEMPWHALPFSNRERKARLSKQFKVNGIPSFIIVDADTGNVITKDGRDKVDDDPEGLKFPWHPKALCDMLKGPVWTQDGEKDLVTTLEGKIRALYFSAHWCPPCRGFTPDLVKAYKKLKEDGKNFEIIFISWDRSQEDFEEYYKEMPWLAFKQGDERGQDLGRHFEVDGIPSLVVLDEDNNVITKNGRNAVGGDLTGKDFPWHPKPLSMLTGSVASAINETISVIYFVGVDDAKSLAAAEMMAPVAERYMADRKVDGDLPEISFFYEGDESDDLPDSIRNFAQLGTDCPLLVVLDIQSETKYIHKADDVTTKDLEDIVNKLRSETLDMDSLR